MDSGSIGFLVGSLLSSSLICVIFFFAIKNLNELLKIIQPENRKMRPDLVWLLLIFSLKFLILLPFSSGLIDYEYYYIAMYVHRAVSFIMIAVQFYIILKIADSIAAEYLLRDIYFESKPTFWVGICLCIAYAIAQLNIYTSLALYGRLASIAYLILFITYWVQTYKIKKILRSSPIPVSEEDSIFKDL